MWLQEEMMIEGSQPYGTHKKFPELNIVENGDPCN
jgi:hypothetical protein